MTPRRKGTICLQEGKVSMDAIREQDPSVQLAMDAAAGL